MKSCNTGNGDDDGDDSDGVWNVHEKIINKSTKIYNSVALEDNSINSIGNNYIPETGVHDS